MPTLRIDGREITVAGKATVLEAARAAGVHVPTLCHRDGVEPFASCMLCTVLDETSGRYLPACATRAVEGMAIVTHSAELTALRRDALDLLLGEHFGDCEGPCRLACPADMDIPRMIRQIREGDLVGAVATVRAHIPLPTVLGWVCPAPCEKACRRRAHDEAVSICLLKRHVGQYALDHGMAMPVPDGSAGGARVAVVGAGPAGLAAAHFVVQHGHACTVFDSRRQAGGGLRDQALEATLPRAVLDGDIAFVLGAGVEFRASVSVGFDVTLDHLREAFDAVILAPGTVEDDAARAFPGVEISGGRIAVDAETLATALPGVIACGDAVRPRRLAVHAVASGRRAALTVDRLLRTGAASGSAERPYNCSRGRVQDEALQAMLQDADEGARIEPVAAAGFGSSEAVAAAARCLHCDCRAARDCRLRDLATEFGASHRTYKGEENRRIEIVRSHPDVIYEPGKCIHCGLCVRACRQAGETVGLGFVGRGYGVRIAAPFGEALERALEDPVRVVSVCPTGALSWARERGDEASGEERA